MNETNPDTQETEVLNMHQMMMEHENEHVLRDPDGFVNFLCECVIKSGDMKTVKRFADAAIEMGVIAHAEYGRMETRECE